MSTIANDMRAAIEVVQSGDGATLPAPLLTAEAAKHHERYMPKYGSQELVSTDDLRWAVGEASGGGYDPEKKYDGHDMTGINFNSLDRIVTHFVRKALHQTFNGDTLVIRRRTEAEWRELFEAWAEAQGFRMSRDAHGYLSTGTGGAWMGFVHLARHLGAVK